MRVLLVNLSDLQIHVSSYQAQVPFVTVVTAIEIDWHSSLVEFSLFVISRLIRRASHKHMRTGLTFSGVSPGGPSSVSLEISAEVLFIIMKFPKEGVINTETLNNERFLVV